MVRATFALSLSLSLLVLAGFWTMDDPEPWVKSQDSAPTARLASGSAE